MSDDQEQTIIRERVRSVLKSIYYSPRFRAVAYAPLDAFERVTGRATR